MLTVVPHIARYEHANTKHQRAESTCKTTVFTSFNNKNNNRKQHITTKTRTIIKTKSKTCTIFGEEKQNDILQTIL